MSANSELHELLKNFLNKAARENPEHAEGVLKKLGERTDEAKNSPELQILLKTLLSGLNPPEFVALVEMYIEGTRLMEVDFLNLFIRDRLTNALLAEKKS